MNKRLNLNKKYIRKNKLKTKCAIKYISKGKIDRQKLSKNKAITNLINKWLKNNQQTFCASIEAVTVFNLILSLSFRFLFLSVFFLIQKS